MTPAEALARACPLEPQHQLLPEWEAAVVRLRALGFAIVPVEPDGATIERIDKALEAAICPRREGPYGLYDYSSYGWSKPHRVRDFRTPESPGDTVFSSDDAASAESECDRLTKGHIARAAYAAAVAPDAEKGKL